MNDINLHTHTCTTCGSSKEIYLLPNEKPEDLKGCVCDRTTEKLKFSDEDLLKKINLAK